MQNSKHYDKISAVSVMKKYVTLHGEKIEYEFEFKKVKNINLRVDSSGIVKVSAPHFADMSRVEEFILSKIEFIRRAQNKRPMNFDYDKAEFLKLCVEDMNVLMPMLNIVTPPHITVRRMKTRWGSCNKSKNRISMNIALMGYPRECIYYVVAHELCHIIHQNHSRDFYRELERIIPNRKEIEKILKQ